MKKFGFYMSLHFDKKVGYEIDARNYTNNKFLDDKVFFEDERCIIILDGIILNKKDILKEYKNNEWHSVLWEMYLNNGELFFEKLRGSFGGVLFDKKEKKYIAFTDQLGTKFIYYYYDNDRIVCSTLISEIYDYFKKNNICYSLDRTSSYLLLSYGFMLGDRTLCEKINVIKPGNYIVVEDGILTINQYYSLRNDEENVDENEAIELIDYTFKEAIREEFEKDKEYGYRHLVALSGGLDSRMTCWVAHEMGYSDQINYTFAQTGSLDQKVPQQIISDLKHEWVFKALDNGLWLNNVDEITRLTGGNVLYYGLSHSYSLYKLLNFDEVGMIHTGQLGDVVISTHMKSPKEEYRFGDGAYTSSFLNRIDKIDVPSFPNKEIGFYYCRYLPGTNNGNMSEYSYTEMYSPFYNLSFIEKCLSIPAKYRYNHYIYKKWILNKYPKAAKYDWTGIQAKITTPSIRLSDREIPINKIPLFVYNRLVGNRGLYNKKNMNPIGYYLETNNELRKHLYSYFDYIDAIEDNELRRDILKLKESSNPFEIIEAISLLAAIKLFYSKN
jgi:asparagine synthase (glutamine-hydrolysing)